MDFEQLAVYTNSIPGHSNLFLNSAMSVLTLQFGQCGNQTGHHLFSLISQDITRSNSCYSSESTERWFRIKPDDSCVARAVLVDTEQKVITEVKKKQWAADSVWKYDEANIIAHSGGGTGNNWAYGHGKKGPELKEMIMESVRKEVERCDTLRATLNLLSSAGGTGSGVGSYMVEAYRDEYPTKTLLNAVVLPYSSGEVVIQNYNTLLTIANLYDVSDMFIIFQNDHLHKMSVNLLKNKNTELHDLNDLIAVKIGSLFQPLERSESSRIHDIISHLTPHPQYKFITLKSAPHYPKEVCKYEAPLEWNVLVRHMKQTLRVSHLDNEPLFDWEMKSPRTHNSEHSLVRYSPCVSNLLVSRGSGASDVKHTVGLSLDENVLYPQWVPEGSRCGHLHHNRRFMDMDKFICLATNNSLIHYSFNSIVEKAWKTFTHKAHLHPYTKFGVEAEDFVEAFAKLENVIKSYKEIK
jgi:tubulin delta